MCYQVLWCGLEQTGRNKMSSSEFSLSAQNILSFWTLLTTLLKDHCHFFHWYILCVCSFHFWYTIEVIVYRNKITRNWNRISNMIWFNKQKERWVQSPVELLSLPTIFFVPHYLISFSVFFLVHSHFADGYLHLCEYVFVFALKRIRIILLVYRASYSV